MTKVKILDDIQGSIKHISAMEDGEYGVIVKGDDFNNIIGHLIVRIDFKQDPLYKDTTKNWTVYYEIGNNWYLNEDDNVWVTPVEELEIRIIK